MSAEEKSLKSQNHSIYSILFDMKDQMGDMQSSLSRVEGKIQSIPEIQNRVEVLEKKYDQEKGAEMQRNQTKTNRDRRRNTVSYFIGVIGGIAGVISTIHFFVTGK